MKQLRVFVVDDEGIIASTLAMVLATTGGFHATAFTEPLKALRAAKSDCPDLLITDVVMPDISGIDLAIEITNACPDCKVLLISGGLSVPDLLKSDRYRGHDFELLQKPIKPLDLLSRIDEIIVATASMPAL